MSDLAVLRTAKVAMDEGLLTQEDFDTIKLAFLKAQQIKAGLDAGFIREEDFLQARDSFLQSLDFRVAGLQSAKSGSLPSPLSSPTAKAPVAPSPRGTTTTASGRTTGLASQNSGGSATAAVSRSTTMPTSQSRSTGGAATGTARPTATASRPASGAAAAAAPAASTIARQNSGTGSLAPPAPAAPAPAGGGALMPGTVAVPDLPRIGKAGVAEGKTSMSGIRVADSCINIYMHIKTKSAFKWVSYKIDDAGAEVVIDQLGTRQSTYEQFLDIMPQNECRFAVYDYGYSNADTQQTVQKLVFVHWAPENSAIKMKMMYASTKEFLKGFLEGIGAELQADSLSELEESEMITRIANNITRK